jgi:hypothetical protein
MVLGVGFAYTEGGRRTSKSSRMERCDSAISFPMPARSPCSSNAAAFTVRSFSVCWCAFGCVARASTARVSKRFWRAHACQALSRHTHVWPHARVPRLHACQTPDAATRPQAVTAGWGETGPVITWRARRRVSGSSSDARSCSSVDVTSRSAVTPKCLAACVCAPVREWENMSAST